MPGQRAWRDIVKNNIVQVAWDRQQQCSDTSTPFCFEVKSVNGIMPKQNDCEYHIRLSLFDATYKQFFGRTWVGPAVHPKSSGQQSLRVTYNQAVCFHTPLKDSSIMLVMELVASSKDEEGGITLQTAGWAMLRIFQYQGQMPDSAKGKAAPAQKLVVYQGSPRALLHLEEPIENSGSLVQLRDSQVVYSICMHSPLQKVISLIPENVIVGPRDVIPGILDVSKESGPAGWLTKPRLVKLMPAFVEKISITLNPSIEKLEEELCKLVDADRIAREQGSSGEGTSITVLERRLQVGVHNGWCYVSEPEVVNLQPDFTNQKATLRRGSIRGHARTLSSSSGGPINALVHKNRVQLEGLREDPAYAVVFTLEYMLGEPVSKKTRMVSMGKTRSFTVGVRWAAWCPLADFKQGNQCLQLHGGPGLNPDLLFFFKTTLVEAGSSNSSLTSLSAGAVAFNFQLQKKDREGEDNRLGVPDMGRSASQLSVQSDGSSVMQAQSLSARPPLPVSARIPDGSPRKGQQLQVPTVMGEISPMYGSSPVPAHGALQPQPYMQGPHFMPPGPYGFTPRGYMPVEITHLSSRSMDQSAVMGMTSQELQELPFTPIHAPIIATAPGMHGGSGLSRSAYAQLATAGFPPVLDRKGEVPEVVDPSDQINFVVAREEADPLQANEIVLQFLAFSRMMQHTGTGPAEQHSTVFFTFQFYRFPQVTSERLLLGQTIGGLSADRRSLPCILQKLNQDGSVHKGPPGYQVKYHVDPAYLRPGEGRLFVQHLSRQLLHIDVWDGDSLLLIGSCVVELKHLCRQGREAIQTTYELDVISTELVDVEAAMPADNGTTDGGVKTSLEASTILQGRLHLRMANVGHPADTKKGDGSLQVKPRIIVNQDTSGVSSFPGGGLNIINSHTQSLKHSKAKAQHLRETNQELGMLLSGQRDAEMSKSQKEAARQRKLARMGLVRQQEGNATTPLILSIAEAKAERARDLQTMQLYRKTTKQDSIQNMLNQAITTQHIVHPSLGTTQFFEFVLRNPYNVDHTVSIQCDDPELSVVTDPREWRHYKMLNEVYTSVEEGMFSINSESGYPELYLRPKEKVNVPFKLLSFKADQTVLPQGPADPFRPQKINQSKMKTNALQPRLAKVYFQTQDGRPLSILAVSIEPQPHVIDQTFRFHHPEQTFFKKSIRLPPLHSLPGVPVGAGGVSQIHVRCSDPNVICESRKVQQGEPHDVFIKAAVGASGQTKRFFLTLYTDPFLSQPFQIWQFYIHSLQRVDVSCVEGQTSRFTLILRGTQAGRLVQGFSSQPTEMQLDPREPFMLGPGSLQELHVGIRPLRAGLRHFFINAVDIETHQLIRNWLVVINCKAPIISKAFELELPVGGGKGSNKRISYTNQYPSSKVFLLRTNRPDLLQFKDPRLELGGGESKDIGLRFAPCQLPGTTEILVFINDEDDKNEETFCVRAIYA